MVVVVVVVVVVAVAIAVVVQEGRRRVVAVFARRGQVVRPHSLEQLLLFGGVEGPVVAHLVPGVPCQAVRIVL
uniref:Putative secreted protein n=1 Tax=Ixodes ricinus TaxID=34613 RepID=A0A6B0U3L0_IXORI